MKDYDKIVKALVLRLNQCGIECNYEVRSSYSEKYNAMITNCYLKFWHSRVVIDNTGKEIVKTIARKNINYFPLEIIVTATYCGLSMSFGLWHPLWVLFFIIPCFRVLTGLFNKKKNSKQYVVEAYNEIIEE